MATTDTGRTNIYSYKLIIGPTEPSGPKYMTNKRFMNEKNAELSATVMQSATRWITPLRNVKTIRTLP